MPSTVNIGKVVKGSRPLKLLIPLTILVLASACSQLETLPVESLSVSAQPLPTPANSQRKDCKSLEKSGWETEELRGRVKSVREEGIEYAYGSGKKELISEMTFNRAGNYTRFVDKQNNTSKIIKKEVEPTFTFDDNCRPLEKRLSGSESGHTRTTYSYSTSGVLKEEATYDSQDRLLWKSVSELDEKDRPIETIETFQEHPEHFNPKRYDVYRETRELFKYDNKGNLSETISYKYDGTLYATYTRVYDAENRLIRLTRLDGKGRPIDQSIYNFDSNGTLKKEMKYNSASYYGNDELAPGKLDSGFGLFQAGVRIEYEYDKVGNWIKRSEYDLETPTKLQSVTFRTIQYH